MHMSMSFANSTMTAAHEGCVPILLSVLKIYSARNVYYRFSVLAVISEHSQC